MGQNIVALDMSTNSVRVAILEASMRAASLRQLLTVDLDHSLEPAEMWAQVRAQLPCSPDTVVVGLDARGNSARLLSFPFVDMRRVESAVRFELEGQLPYDLNDVITTWSVGARAGKQMEVLAAVVPKAPLQETMDALTRAGLEPRATVQPAVALAEFLPLATEEPVAVLSLGGSQSHLAIVHHGVRYVRTLRAGGDDIDIALARYLGQPVEAVRDLKAEMRVQSPAADASDDDKQRFEALLDGLGPLVTGLVSTFKSLPPHLQPTRLLLSGGLSRLIGLSELLGRRLGVKAELLDLRASLNPQVTPPAAIAPEYAVAVGLVLAQFRLGRDIPLNFRRGEMAYQGDIQLYRGQITRLGLGIAIVLSLAIGTSVVRYTLLRSEAKEIDQGFCQATQRLIGHEICDPTAALASLRQAPGSDGVVIPSFSAGALLELLSKSIASNLDVQFDELDMRVEAGPGQPERFTGKGETVSFEAAEALEGLIKRDPCVQEARVVDPRKTHNTGRVEFKLQVKVLCPPGVQPGTQLTAAAAPAPPSPPGQRSGGD